MEVQCQDIDQVLLHDIIFCLSVFSSSEELGKITSIRSKRLGKKREETVKPTCFMSKVTSVPQTPQTNHSQYSSPVEPLNLIVDISPLS